MPFNDALQPGLAMALYDGDENLGRLSRLRLELPRLSSEASRANTPEILAIGITCNLGIPSSGLAQYKTKNEQPKAGSCCRFHQLTCSLTCSSTAAGLDPCSPLWDATITVVKKRRHGHPEASMGSPVTSFDSLTHP